MSANEKQAIIESGYQSKIADFQKKYGEFLNKISGSTNTASYVTSSLSTGGRGGEAVLDTVMSSLRGYFGIPYRGLGKPAERLSRRLSKVELMRKLEIIPKNLQPAKVKGQNQKTEITDGETAYLETMINGMLEDLGLLVEHYRMTNTVVGTTNGDKIAALQADIKDLDKEIGKFSSDFHKKDPKRAKFSEEALVGGIVDTPNGPVSNGVPILPSADIIYKVLEKDTKGSPSATPELLRTVAGDIAHNISVAVRKMNDTDTVIVGKAKDNSHEHSDDHHQLLEEEVDSMATAITQRVLNTKSSAGLDIIDDVGDHSAYMTKGRNDRTSEATDEAAGKAADEVLALQKFFEDSTAETRAVIDFKKWAEAAIDSKYAGSMVLPTDLQAKWKDLVKQATDLKEGKGKNLSARSSLISSSHYLFEAILKFYGYGEKSKDSQLLASFHDVKDEEVLAAIRKSRNVELSSYLNALWDEVTGNSFEGKTDALVSAFKAIAEKLQVPYSYSLDFHKKSGVADISGGVQDLKEYEQSGWKDDFFTYDRHHHLPEWLSENIQVNSTLPEQWFMRYDRESIVEAYKYHVIHDTPIDDVLRHMKDSDTKSGKEATVKSVLSDLGQDPKSSGKGVIDNPNAVKDLHNLRDTHNWVDQALTGEERTKALASLKTKLLPKAMKGGFGGDASNIHNGLKELGHPTATRTHFSKMSKAAITEYVRGALLSAMKRLWADANVKTVDGALFEKRAIKQRELKLAELQDLRDNNESIPSDLGIGLPKSSLFPSQHKKKLIKAVNSVGTMQEAKKVNPFTAAHAEEYTAGLIDNITGSKLEKKEPAQLSPGDAKSFGQGFWTNIKYFVKTFEDRYKDFYERMSETFSESNPHTVPDLSNEIGAAGSKYNKAVVDYNNMLAKTVSETNSNLSPEDASKMGKNVIEEVKSNVARFVKGTDSKDYKVAHDLLYNNPVVARERAAFSEASAGYAEVASAEGTEEHRKALRKTDMAYRSLLLSMKNVLTGPVLGMDAVKADLLARSVVNEDVEKGTHGYSPSYKRIGQNLDQTKVSPDVKKAVSSFALQKQKESSSTAPSTSEIGDARKLLDDRIGGDIRSLGLDVRTIRALKDSEALVSQDNDLAFQRALDKGVSETLQSSNYQNRKNLLTVRAKRMFAEYGVSPVSFGSVKGSKELPAGIRSMIGTAHSAEQMEELKNVALRSMYSSNPYSSEKDKDSRDNKNWLKEYHRMALAGKPEETAFIYLQKAVDSLGSLQEVASSRGSKSSVADSYMKQAVSTIDGIVGNLAGLGSSKVMKSATLSKKLVDVKAVFDAARKNKGIEEEELVNKYAAGYAVVQEVYSQLKAQLSRILSSMGEIDVTGDTGDLLDAEGKSIPSGDPTPSYEGLLEAIADPAKGAAFLASYDEMVRENAQLSKLRSELLQPMQGSKMTAVERKAYEGTGIEPGDKRIMLRAVPKDDKNTDETTRAAIESQTGIKVNTIFTIARQLVKEKGGWVAPFRLAMDDLLKKGIPDPMGSALAQGILDSLKLGIDTSLPSESNKQFDAEITASLKKRLLETPAYDAALKPLEGAMISGDTNASVTAADAVLKKEVPTIAKATGYYEPAVARAIASQLYEYKPFANRLAYARFEIDRTHADLEEVMKGQMPAKTGSETVTSAPVGPKREAIGLAPEDAMERHLYPGDIEEGLFRAMKGYFNELKKSQLFLDVLATSPVPAGLEKSAADKTPLGKATKHSLEPGLDLHKQAIRDMETYHDRIVGNRLYVLVSNLLKLRPNASMQMFYNYVADWNGSNPGNQITVKTFEGLMESIAQLLGVEKIYEEEATRVRSKFTNVARGIYRSLADLEKKIETGVKAK